MPNFDNIKIIVEIGRLASSRALGILSLNDNIKRNGLRGEISQIGCGLSAPIRLEYVKKKSIFRSIYKFLIILLIFTIATVVFVWLQSSQ